MLVETFTICVILLAASAALSDAVAAGLVLLKMKVRHFALWMQSRDGDGEAFCC